ncbi:HD domain-containing protein [Elizabethkingia miricola]|uniref:HD domain-containing protein n=1 Tax=Elizabethkingia miricola TaxID=172045 RepID=UPI00389277AA
MDLKDVFFNISTRYTTDIIFVDSLWKEIEKKYNSKNRYYHNLFHLENMICELKNIEDFVNDFDTLLFSVFYHDIIYKSTAKDNEEKSAEIAKSRLEKLGVLPEDIEKVFDQILATKSHNTSTNIDTIFLIDADLSILGKTWNEYEKYIGQIRKEYSIYPDFLYKSGRKKVLQCFLGFDEIYKTDLFRNQYEKQARENIQKEIELL